MPITRQPSLIASIAADAMTPLMPGAGPPPTRIPKVGCIDATVFPSSAVVLVAGENVRHMEMRRPAREKALGVFRLPQQCARDEILEVVVGLRAAFAANERYHRLQLLPCRDRHGTARFEKCVFRKIPQFDEHAQRLPKVQIGHFRMRLPIDQTTGQTLAILRIGQASLELATKDVV